MSTLVRTQSLSDVVTRQDLWNIIETTRVEDVTLNDLSDAARRGIVVSASEPPDTLVNGQLWFDQTNQLLRVFDANASYAYAVGPDCFEVICRAACPLLAGAAVRVSAWNDPYEVWVTPVLTGYDGILTFGITSRTTESGGFVPVTVAGMVRGYVA